MLILMRRPGELIDVTVPPSNKATHITIASLKIDGNQARLGIDAPRGVTIDRREITERKRANEPCSECGITGSHDKTCSRDNAGNLKTTG
jgi:carbon storage regulator CsrA